MVNGMDSFPLWCPNNFDGKLTRLDMSMNVTYCIKPVTSVILVIVSK